MKDKKTVLEKNPVLNTAKWAMSLMKNKLVASLLLLVQGVLFIVSPEGNMIGTVRIAAVFVILASAVNILLHLFSGERSWMDILLSVVNGAFVAAGIGCLMVPEAVEPYVRTVAGAMMILINLVNLAETLKIENKRDWKFAVGVIASIVMMGLGLTMIIAGSEKTALVQMSSGIFLILNALVNIWYIIRLGQTGKKGAR